MLANSTNPAHEHILTFFGLLSGVSSRTLFTGLRDEVVLPSIIRARPLLQRDRNWQRASPSLFLVTASTPFGMSGVATRRALRSTPLR